MESKISFKIKHKKIEILSNSRVIDTLTINEFNNLCSELEIFKANNPALFENTLDVISTDFLNYEKFGDNMSLGDDFLKGLLAINIRALYFYKKAILTYFTISYTNQKILPTIKAILTELEIIIQSLEMQLVWE